MRKTSSRISRLLAMLLVCMLAVTLVYPAYAADNGVNQAVQNDKSGVVQIRFCGDGAAFGMKTALSTGTGFLINEDTVITCNHCVNPPEAFVEMLVEGIKGVNEEDVHKMFTVEVTVYRDQTVKASIISSSTEMDYAILKLEQPIANRTFLTLRDSDTVQQSESCWALGFPGDLANDQSVSYYDSESVVVTSGSVTLMDKMTYTTVGSFLNPLHILGIGCKWNEKPGDHEIANFLHELKNVKSISHSALIAGGNSGGPLVDSDGNVIGINNAGSDTRNYAIATSELIGALDSFGIKYTKAGESTPAPTEATTEAATEATAEAETEAATIETAAVETTVATVPQPVEPAPAKKDNTMMYIAIGGIALVVVAVVLLLTRKKKPAPAPVAAGRSGAATTGFAPSQPVAPAPVVRTNTSSAETSILSQGSNETTILTQKVNGGTLHRKKTGKDIAIGSSEFMIGREASKVNYCISDNDSISRTHAKFSVRNGVTYVKDMKAANGTFVNGVKVAPLQEVALKNGDKIELANEEFEYRV